MFSFQFEATANKMPTDSKWLLLILPETAADAVRAQPNHPAMETGRWRRPIEVTINSVTFNSQLEPTSEGGFFLSISPQVKIKTGLQAGEKVQVYFEYLPLESFNSNNAEEFVAVSARHVRRVDGVEVEIVSELIGVYELAYTKGPLRLILDMESVVDENGYPDGSIIFLASLDKNNPNHEFTKEDIKDMVNDITSAEKTLRTHFRFEPPATEATVTYTEVEKKVEDELKALGFHKVEEISGNGETGRYYKDEEDHAIFVGADWRNPQSCSIEVKPLNSPKYYALWILMRAFPEMRDASTSSYTYESQLSFLKQNFKWLFASDIPYRDRYDKDNSLSTNSL